MITHRKGSEAAYESVSDDPRLRCVFEDDGNTGYLYAMDYSDGSPQPIKDAVAIYNVEAANDLDHEIEFLWSRDGRRCALKVNGVAEAFVDFDRKLAAARTNFPEVSLWTRQPRVLWTDTLVEKLKS